MIQVDDFDVFKERMFGSGDKKLPPHRRALLFVDNAGADIVLGMLPLARELLRRGTEVSTSLAYLYVGENHSTSHGSRVSCSVRRFFAS